MKVDIIYQLQAYKDDESKTQYWLVQITKTSTSRISVTPIAKFETSNGVSDVGHFMLMNEAISLNQFNIYAKDAKI